jgi:hypothetical protein
MNRLLTSDPFLSSWRSSPEPKSPKSETFAVMHCDETPIYVFPEKELRGLSPNSHIHVSVSDLSETNTVFSHDSHCLPIKIQLRLQYCTVHMYCTYSNFWCEIQCHWKSSIYWAETENIWFGKIVYFCNRLFDTKNGNFFGVEDTADSKTK